MSPLRERLRRPQTWLALLVVAAVLGAADLARVPGEQTSARAYLAFVGAYQTHGRPLLKGRVACRYTPTCSEYSRQAVTRFGLLEGLRLTVIRVHSCRPEVPAGTSDPLPGARHAH